jgi:cobalt-zinc-cadmium efflux system protein
MNTKNKIKTTQNLPPKSSDKGSHHHDHSDVKNIKAAFFLNLFFTIFEIAGGFFTNSMAILSDAVHDFGDCVSLGLAWYFQKMTRKASDNSFSYGYKRFSLLGAIINSIVLVVGSIFILSSAIPRIFHPEKAQAEGMIILAIVGVLVNGAAVFRLKKGNTINEKVVSLHFLEDVLGWLAILLGAVVMHFFNLPVIDPLLSVGIALFVLSNVYKNIRQTLHIILQGIPDEVDITEISELLQQFKGIDDIHDLHVWSVDGNYNVLTVHAVVGDTLPMEKLAELKTEIRESLQIKGIQHATIEFETENEKCVFEKCGE